MKQSFSTRGLLLFVILLITFIAFFPSLQSGFTNWDDEGHFLLNPHVVHFDIEHILQNFQSTVNLTYIPLTTLSFAIEYHFFGLNPFVFHLDNLLLHLAVVFLVFYFALRMGLDLEAAVLSALLFGIHPMRVESVAWITERKDVLYAFFYMLSLNSYCRFIDERKKIFYGLSILYGFLSILAKPMALSLPLILWLCDWFKGREFTRKILWEKIPYFLFIIPIAWMTYSLNARLPEASMGSGFLTWIWTFTEYISKFLFPFNISPLYTLPKPVAISNPFYITALLLLASIFIFVVVFRNIRLLKFAFLYYFFSIFFLLRFDDLKDINIVADRFMYLPSLGFCLLIGFFIKEVSRQARAKGRLVLRSLFYMLIIFYSLLLSKTFLQNYVWEDSFSLWSNIIRHNPQTAFAYYNKAKVYEFIRDFDSALEDYNKSIEINPGFVESYHDRGNIYQMKGQYDLALADFNKAVELNPCLSTTYTNRGNLYYAWEKEDLAIQDYTHALTLQPKDIFTLSNRGVVYQSQGEYDLALADFNRMLEMAPQSAAAYVNRGNLYSELEQNDSAIADYTRALELDSKMTAVYYNRATVYEAKGEYAKALEDVQRSQLAHKPEVESYIAKLEQLVKTK